MLTWIQENKLNSIVIVLVAVIAFASGRQSVLDNGGVADASWSSGFWQNFSTEMIGAVVTFFLFEMVVGGWQRTETKKEARLAKFEADANAHWDKVEAEADLKRELITRMGSRHNMVVITATESLRAKGWMINGGLVEAALWRANLNNADLQGANLEKANLYQANLKEADLQQANLQETELGEANLQQANLSDANLLGAILLMAEFDEKTILPDAMITGLDGYGQPIYDKYWNSDVDMKRYTDPEHPNFWRPAYLHPNCPQADKPLWLQISQRH